MMLNHEIFPLSLSLNNFDNTINNDKFYKLSAKIAYLQNELFSRFGIEKIFIGGGSARSILDNFYFGKELRMRDLDIFINWGSMCTNHIAQQIGEALHASILGDYSHKDLRPRPRTLPYATTHLEYNAGYGFFWINKDKEIIDLSIFHSAFDMKLNGIFDIDKILIPLDHKTSLSDLINKYFYALNLNQLMHAQIVEDKYRGYTKWIKGKAKIVNWPALKRDPIVTAIRVVRTYGKLNYDKLPNAVHEHISMLIETTTVYNKFQFSRNLVKIYSDERYLWVLNILSELGVLKFLHAA